MASVRMSGCDEGAGAVWKPNYRLQGAPQSSWGEPDQRPARSQRVTAPTASRSRWQPWGDWPGTECDILGVTGRHVRENEERADWPQGSPIQTHCQINLPERTALSTSLSCSKLFSSCPSSTELRPKRRHRSAFQVLPRPAPGYLTDSSPASPFPNPLLQPNGFVVLQTSSSVSPQPPCLCSFHFISLGMSFPHSLLLLFISLSKPAHIQSPFSTTSS